MFFKKRRKSDTGADEDIKLQNESAPEETDNNEDFTEESESQDYSESDFFSFISCDFITINRTSSIKEAMRKVISEAGEKKNIYTIFVTENDKFYGAIKLGALISARSTESLNSLIERSYPIVTDEQIAEEELDGLTENPEDLIPVISTEDREILGVISARDLVLLTEDTLGDDYAKLAALASEEEEGETVRSSVKKRAPWLIVLLLLGLLVSWVVGAFEWVVAELPIIVAFQSLILGMAGNVGTQSLAVTVRNISASGTPDKKERLKITLKETRVALFGGVVLGALSFILAFPYLLIVGTTLSLSLSCAGCVAVAMCLSMAISGFMGTIIPLTLDRLKIDPAVASGPLITTINDLVAVISYYGLVWLFLILIH